MALNTDCVNENIPQLTEKESENIPFHPQLDAAMLRKTVGLQDSDPEKFLDIALAHSSAVQASSVRNKTMNEIAKALKQIEAGGRDRETKSGLRALMKIAKEDLGIVTPDSAGELHVLDKIADMAGRSMRGVINEYRKDAHFASGIEQAISMDDTSAERYMQDFAKKIYADNDKYVPYVEGRGMSGANSGDEIHKLMNSVAQQMESANAGLASIYRFREPPVAVNNKAIAKGGLRGWREFVLANPELLGYQEMPNLKREYGVDGSGMKPARRQELERFIVESYNYHAYGRITDVSLINRRQTSRFRFQLDNFAKWQTLHNAYGHKKDLGAHLAREISDRVQDAGREVGIKRTFGSNPHIVAEKFMRYIESSVEAKSTWGGLAHRRTYAILQTVADNSVRTSDFAPKIGRAINSMIDAINSPDEDQLNAMMTDIEKKIQFQNNLNALSKFVLRDMWKPASAAKLAAAPFLIPGDVIMRSEISSDVGSLRHSFFGTAASDGVTQLMGFLPYWAGKGLGVIPGVKVNPILRHAYAYAEVADQEILSMVQAENSRMFAMAQTAGWSNKAYRVYEAITGQGALNEMPFLISRMNASTRITNYIGNNYEAMMTGRVSKNPLQNRGAAEFYQTFLKDKITSSDWGKLNKAGSIKKLKETDYDTWLTI